MKVLHLSHNGLPDWRIEKSAMTACKNGYKTFFAGDKQANDCVTSAFSKTFEIDWFAGGKIGPNSGAKLGLPYYWGLVKKRIRAIIEETRPDIIHAHNIYSGKMALQLKLPFVYDDHEYWSKQASLTGIRRNSSFFTRMPRTLARHYVQRLWSSWEEEIVTTTPVITVSESIIDDFKARYQNDKLFLLPNFPTRMEIQDFGQPRKHTKLISIYAGVEALHKNVPHRNIDGFPELFESNDIGGLVLIGPKAQSSAKVRYTGFLKREDMFSEMANGSIGILPWKKHWFHQYANPNKVYEYAHAGLFVISTSSLKMVTNALKENCATFDDYECLVSQLQTMNDDLDELYNKRIKIFEFARSNLVWEIYERNIFSAYQAC